MTAATRSKSWMEGLMRSNWTSIADCKSLGTRFSKSVSSPWRPCKKLKKVSIHVSREPKKKKKNFFFYLEEKLVLRRNRQVSLLLETLCDMNDKQRIAASLLHDCFEEAVLDRLHAIPVHGDDEFAHGFLAESAEFNNAGLGGAHEACRDVSVGASHWTHGHDEQQARASSCEGADQGPRQRIHPLRVVNGKHNTIGEESRRAHRVGPRGLGRDGDLVHQSYEQLREGLEACGLLCQVSRTGARRADANRLAGAGWYLDVARHDRAHVVLANLADGENKGERARKCLGDVDFLESTTETREQKSRPLVLFIIRQSGRRDAIATWRVIQNRNTW